MTGGPRSTAGSIHRQSVVAVLKRLRESGARWMHWEARWADCRGTARNRERSLEVVGREGSN